MPDFESTPPQFASEPKNLLSRWGQERALRVARSLFGIGMVLSLIALIADSVWSELPVVVTDFFLLCACALSWYWSRAARRPVYFWWPAYWAFWLSILPSLWSTGGLQSPFFGVDLAAIYAIGAIMESRRSWQTFYLYFALAHIPVFCLIQNFHRLPQMNMAPIFSGTITGVTLLAIFICVRSLLKNEQTLAQEFAGHYRDMARAESERHEAERLSSAKMQFLANMSHEIRTPMNSILGFSDLLASSELSVSEEKEYIHLIRSNGQQLLHLIDDILDLSKFEAGRIPIHKTPISIAHLFEEVTHSFAPTLSAKGLALQLSYSGDISRRCHGDLHRMKQVLINLLSNAIKFSENGVIKMTVGCQTHESGRMFNLIVDIHDTGIGIAAEHQTKLFHPFSQADTSISRKFGGNGLGLALSRRIAEAMGGQLLLVSSVPGKGSHFSFSVPLEYAGGEEAAVTAGAEGLRMNLTDKRILLVEDSTDNALLIRHYMQGKVGAIDVATDGEKAVQAAADFDYDCILMDIQMPGMDGLEATRQIRSHGFSKPIIALTAHALPAEAERSAQAGCTVHLTKPISRGELIGTLTQYLH